MLFSPVTPSYVFEVEVLLGQRQPNDDEVGDDEERKPVAIWLPRTFRLTGTFVLSPVPDEPNLAILLVDGQEYVLNIPYEAFREKLFIVPNNGEEETDEKEKLH